MARRPSIPLPANDAQSLYNTCMSLKQAVETLQGVSGTANAPSMFVRPDAPPVVRDGDFWLSAGAPSVTLSVAVSGRWFVVGTLA